MNTTQKRIMIAVIVIIVGMLVYPPFQVVAKNGVVFNMGYGWIFDPPKRGYIAASVDVPMLLIQWVGVLVVGGLALFLAKNSSQASAFPSAVSMDEQTSHAQPIPIPENNSTTDAQAQNKASPKSVALKWARWPAVFGMIVGISAAMKGSASLVDKIILGIMTGGLLALILGGTTFAIVFLAVKIRDNNQKETLGAKSFQPHIVQSHEGRTIIKRILITMPFVLLIALLVGVIKELIAPGLLRWIIITFSFLSIYKFWSWSK